MVFEPVPSAPRILKLSRERLWTAAALSAASLAILASAPAQYLGRQQDDLFYLIGSRSLLEGRYRLLTVPGEPPLYHMNPGWPLVLAPVTLLFGERFAFHQGFAALLLAAAPWLLWLWLRRRVEPAAAVLIATAFAFSPLVLSQAGTVMSEAFSLLLTIALLSALERGRAGAASAALLGLVATRMAALALLPATAASAWAKRRWKSPWFVLGPALAALAAWTLWSWRAAGTLQKTEELRLSYSSGGLGRVLSVALENAAFYLASLGSCALPEVLGGGKLGLALGFALAAAAVVGCRKLLKRDRRDPLVWSLAGLAALHLVWPWQYERYWIAPLPLLLAAAAQGLGKENARWALGALVAAELMFHVPRWASHGGPFETPELAATYAWLSAHTEPRDIIASALYVRDGYWSGRPAIPLPPAPSSQALADDLRRFRARWVVDEGGLELGLARARTAVVAGELERLSAALKDRRLFRLAHEETSEDARVYEVRP